MAGQPDPWNFDAGVALGWWGGDWLGMGGEVPGAAFIYNGTVASEDWCDRITSGSNAVQWSLPEPRGLLTPCNAVFVDQPLGVTIKTDFNGAASNADVIFNKNHQWTTAETPLSRDPPFNFRAVAMHEFGHALGLDHEDDTLAVMNTRYHYAERLHADDRAGLRALYPGPGTQTDLGPSIWKKTDGSSLSPSSLVSYPTSAVAGQAITLEWTQENFGTTYETFNVGFFLGGTLLGRNLGAFEYGGSSNTYSRTVTIPLNTGPGTYALGVCLDDDNAVTESDELNNCLNYPQPIQITAPADLVITALTNYPASANAGASFNVADTTANVGSGRAAASTTRYRLSLDATITGGPSIGRVDFLLTGSRSVPELAGGSWSPSGQVSVTIPVTIAPGTYYLGACADHRYVVAESNEFDNCRASASTVQVTNVDLAIDSVSLPPAVVSPGTSFSMRDTTLNLGTGSAGASTMNYWLSTDSNITGADLLVSGNRAVPTLAAGARSTGTLTVIIPATVAAGTYYLAACADAMRALAESNEGNNCRGVALQVQ